MKTLIRKFSRTAITVVLVILAFIAIFNAWVYYTESPWTRDARFSADVVAIATGRFWTHYPGECS